MRQPKREYEVYLVGTGTGVYAKEYCREYMGTTWAVSANQAINYVRYRNRNKNNPYGGPVSWDQGDILGEGTVHYTYEAICIS